MQRIAPAGHRRAGFLRARTVRFVLVVLVVGSVVAVAGGSATAAAPKTPTAARSELRAVGLNPTGPEVDCILGRAKQTRRSVASVVAAADSLLACFAQQVLAAQLVAKVGAPAGRAACVTLALRNAPWIAFVDVYRGFVAVGDGRFTTDAAFQGRFQSFVRGCSSPSDASPLLLGELTSRWNVAAARRTAAAFQPIAGWTAVEGSLVSAGDVGFGTQLLAFSVLAQGTGATNDPALELNGAALTLRPLPNLPTAMAAAGAFAEAMDASGRAGPVGKGLRLDVVLGASPVRSRVRVANVVYTAQVLTQRDAPPALQITAILSVSA